MTNDYDELPDLYQAYIKAIDHPLPELKKAFEDESRILFRHISSLEATNQARALSEPIKILDAGCGTSRTLMEIAKEFPHMQLTGIDISKQIVEEAKKRSKGWPTIQIYLMDALHTTYLENSFDMVYSTFNVIGSIPKEHQQQFITEQSRILKPNGYIITNSWDAERTTTEFLKEYYRAIGLQVIHADETRTVTDKATMERVNIETIKKLYETTGITYLSTQKLGDIWLSHIGMKQ
jgi:ubiquinone/menaquinone biosynthesis C-methylase UbiE